MPELPEAETIARTLAPHAEGRRIVSVRFLSKRVHDGSTPKLAGRTIRRVRRYGKRVVFELDRGVLVFRLGMTGSLLWSTTPGPYTRAFFKLDQGNVCFNDIRQFGSVKWMAEPPQDLGPDPLEVSAEEFYTRLRGRRVQLKRLLLDQQFLRGIGNIYADESLFRARIHPQAQALRLSVARARRLHQAIVDVLKLAIDNCGSSISDYLDARGQRGNFQQLHQVYGKQDQPCPQCGALIRRIVVAQRGTHYCPKCQRA